MEKIGGKYGGYTPVNSKEPTLQEKKNIVHMAMYRNQPTFDDFVGFDGYSKREINEDKQKLESKIRRIEKNSYTESNDEFAHDMEPILTYLLQDRFIMPTREHFSFLASEYDDKFRGTDIVFGVRNRETNKCTAFAVDVATGTNEKNINGKFRKSFDEHGGVANLKYCMYKDERWEEKSAPHFVLGMSPGSQNQAMDRVVIKNGELKGHEEDPIYNFMLLSEMREQAYLHLAFLKNKLPVYRKTTEKQVAKIVDLLGAIHGGLYRVFKINEKSHPDPEERRQFFEQKYQSTRAAVLRADKVYANIVNETDQRRKRLLGIAARTVTGNKKVG